jgi:hypothetical protein
LYNKGGTRMARAPIARHAPPDRTTSVCWETV